MQPTKDSDPNQFFDFGQFVLAYASIETHIVSGEIECQLIAFKPSLHFALIWKNLEELLLEFEISQINWMR